MGQGAVGGEQQRIGFARLLVMRPDIVIMDEATSALDAASQDSMMELFRDELGHATLISVGHRSELEDYHERKLTLHRHATRVEMAAGENIRPAGGCPACCAGTCGRGRRRIRQARCRGGPIERDRLVRCPSSRGRRRIGHGGAGRADRVGQARRPRLSRRSRDGIIEAGRAPPSPRGTCFSTVPTGPRAEREDDGRWRG